MRRILVLLSCAALAAPALRGATRPSVSSPAPGEIRLEWSSRPEGLEWEAFLSVDGGETFPIRITPHLDARVRIFTARLPGVASGGARLRLRVGDGTRETETELPLPLVVAAAPGVLSPSAPDALGAPVTGENNDLWIEGSSSGASLRLRGRAGAMGFQAPTRIESAARNLDVLPPSSATFRRPGGRPACASPNRGPRPPNPSPRRLPLSLTSRLNV